MIINEEGTYTLRYTATDDCGKTTEVERELVVERPTVFGIRSTSASSPVCQRTDAAARFSDPVPQHSDGNGGWVGGSSPFDDIMPWSGIEVVEDADAGTLVKIPKFWYKWTINGDEISLQISNEEKDGFLVSPAHESRSSEDVERDFVYVGRYHCVSDYKSASGVLPLGQKIQSDFRSGIQNLGTGIYMMDYAMYWTIAMLYLVEYANWDSQAMIGGGCSDSGSKENNGLTDSMTYHTGTTNTSVGAEDYGHIQYRYIEDLWANVYDILEGVYSHNDTQNMRLIINPSRFGGSTGANIGEFTALHYTTQFVQSTSTFAGYDFPLIPSSGNANKDISRTHDQATCVKEDTAFHIGGSYDKSDTAGLFHFMGFSKSSATGSVGSRLMKLPNA